MKLKAILYLLFAVLLLQSCGKDGAVGPAGAKGDTGVTGATGATGNANVSSYIFLNQSVDTTTLAIRSGLYYQYSKLFTLPDSAYKKAYNGGLIFTYFRNPLDKAGIWYPANGNTNPLIAYYDNVYFTTEKQGVRMYIEDFPNKEAILQAKFDVQIVLVPASSIITVSALKVNTKDLMAVKKALHLN